MAPRQLPGIYMILCLKNNKRYYGETTNVSARLSKHKSKLRRNIHEVSELQRDWNIYGESFFEFITLYISSVCNKIQRVALEVEYIARHYDICYNKILNSSRKKTILFRGINIVKKLNNKLADLEVY
uniref:Putative GIY YIG homing endonuclease n=1 Tax=Haematococcus lacustris TaxID=44745 RepID=A0A0S2IE11_HAELA|nr:putative GIY YIG homing endonuclease [Haematococcus lacustris]